MDGIRLLTIMLLCFCSIDGKGLLYPHMTNNGDTEYTHSHTRVNLTDTYVFYNEEHNHLYVQKEGSLVFDQNNYYAYFSNMDWDFAMYGPKMIAPLWSRVQLGASGSHIWYREETGQELLDRATHDIQSNFGRCGNKFVARTLFITTWQRVASECSFDPELAECGISANKKRSGSQSASKQTKMERGIGDDYPRNSFQVVLATNGQKTFAIFNIYDVQWDCCLNENTVGFNEGDEERYYRSHHVATLPQRTNVDKLGRYMYMISGYHVRRPNCHIQDHAPELYKRGISGDE